MEKKTKLIALASAVAIMGAVGVTGFAASAPNSNIANDGIAKLKNVVKQELTEEQKTQMTTDMKAKLAEELAAGKITQEQYDQRLKALEDGKMLMMGKGQRGMSEEQKAKMDAVNEKWKSLTDIQKQEIYSIHDEKSAAEGKLVNKYLEFGLIDEAAATEMKTNIANENSKMKENGTMPMMNKGMRGGKPAQKATNNVPVQ